MTALPKQRALARVRRPERSIVARSLFAGVIVGSTLMALPLPALVLSAAYVALLVGFLLEWRRGGAR
jgi:hypothetical protein